MRWALLLVPRIDCESSPIFSETDGFVWRVFLKENYAFFNQGAVTLVSWNRHTSMLSAASLSRISCSLVERPSAFLFRMSSLGLLVRHGGSETSVLGCAAVCGTIAHLLQTQLPSCRAAVAAYLVNPEQDRWYYESQ